MKTIGIKLADGSFYPVLKEGTPSERLLALTTAHNNQTKVMVDLYRSEKESMEDAEYVDSLQIEDLNEHPNGVPTLSFTVSIDENNKLSAKIVDNETGLQSNANITLVSRTLEERLLPDEYDIKDPTIEGVSLTSTEENSLFESDDSESDNNSEPGDSASDESIDFSFEPDLPDFNASAPESPSSEENPLESEPDVVNEFDAPVEETAISEEAELEEPVESEERPEEVPAETPAEDSPAESPVEENNTISEEELSSGEENLSHSDLDSIREQLVAEPDASDITEIQQEPASSDFELPPMSDFNPLNEPILEDDALTIDEFNQSEEKTETETSDIEVSDDNLSEDFSADSIPEESEINPEESVPESSDETISSESLDLSFDIPEENTENSNDEVQEALTSDLDLDLPDFNFEDSSQSDNTEDQTESSSGDFDLEDTKNTSSLDDLDLPDFDTSLNDLDSLTSDTTSNNQTFSTDSSSDPFNTDDLDFSNLDSTESADNSNSYLDDLDFDDLDTSASSQATGKGLSFTGLYDKETAMGNSAANSDDEDHKNPKAAVIICILCAIICVLATLFVIMVIQPKLSLFVKSRKAPESETQITATELPDLRPAKENPVVEESPEPEPLPEVEAEPVVPQAQEEEVVIIENAEDVVPLPPPVTPVKPKDISYKIKWGDTLWDISDTYYKNPWRYKYIARYNGIKNPDYIVSGTYISIPAE